MSKIDDDRRASVENDDASVHVVGRFMGSSSVVPLPHVQDAPRKWVPRS